MPKTNITRRALLGSAAGAALIAAGPVAGSPVRSFRGAACAPQRQIIPYRTVYIKGNYGCWANNWALWNPSGLKHRVNYDAYWTIYPNTFPKNTRCTWYLPSGNIPTGAGVWGYYLIGYGNYDGATIPGDVEPLEVCNINEFISEYDFMWTGDRYFNNLNELFLVRHGQKTGENSSIELLEVAFFLHFNEDTVKYHESGMDLGIHTNNGVAYTCRMVYGSTLPDAYYVNFVAADREEHLVGSIDWKAVLEYLIAKNIITGSEWINGISIGVEVGGRNPPGYRRHGTITYNDWTVTFTGSTAAPSADYLGTNLLPDGNGFSGSWKTNGLTVTSGQGDADGGTGAVLLSETTDNTVHYFTTASAVTVPSEAGDYLWFEDIKTIGGDFVVFILADGSFSNQLVMRWRLSTNMFHFSGPTIGTGLTNVQLENNPSRSYYLTLQSISIAGTNGFHRVFWRFRKAAGITQLNLRVGTALGNIADQTAADYTFAGDPANGIIIRPRHRLVNVA